MARELVRLTPGERWVDCWAANRQGYRHSHNYLVLTSNRLLYLFATGTFSKGWKVVVDVPLESLKDPGTALGYLRVAGRGIPLGFRAGAACSAIARLKAERLYLINHPPSGPQGLRPG